MEMTMKVQTKYDDRHGGPYDRGSADAYYGRKFNPHYYSGATGSSLRIALTKEDPEYAAYLAGWEEEDDRKDWGD
jgi:hypothetical protein